MPREMRLVIVRIGDSLQIAADDGFGLVVFSHRDGFEALLARGHINVTAQEIHEVCALQEELSHPSVVVVLCGDVAIGTLLGFRGAHGVRNKCAEGLAAQSFSRNGLLRVVKPFAIGVLRADENRAGRARRRDAVICYRAVHTKHENVVAQNLKVVACVVPREETLVVQHRGACVRRHLQVAAEAGRRPGSVAGVAGHFGVAVGKLRVVGLYLALDDPIFIHELRAQ